MYNILRTFFQSEKREREVKQDLLEIENRLLDQAVIEEENQKQNNNKNANDGVNEDNVNTAENVANSGACSSRRGVISRLTDTGGIIDGFIYFETKAAIPFYDELHTGCVVEYLSYKNEKMENKVIKIQEIIENNWNEAATVTRVSDNKFGLPKI